MAASDAPSESRSGWAGDATAAVIAAADERYRVLVEQVPAVTYLARVSPHRDMYVSPQVEALLGFSPAEWLANPALWVERLHPQDRARVRAEWAAAQAEGGPFRSEYRLLGRDGRAVWVRDEARVVRDETGGPLYLLGVMLDVTGRRQAEEALRSAEARFRILTQSLSDAVYEADLSDPAKPAGTLLFVSDRIEAVMGYPAERWHRRPGLWLEGLHPQDRERVLAALDALRAGGETLEIEYRWIKPSGDVVWIQDRMRLERGPDGQPLLLRGTLADVTARRRTQEELYRREQEFKAVVETARDFIARFDRDMRYVYVNPAAERIVGAPAQAILGRATGDFGLDWPAAQAWSRRSS